MELGRRGFRLPTEEEWEGSSRGRVRTTYGYGGDVGLFGRFGWFRENSGKQVHPPRKLRPSLHGMFDLHGNLYECTHDWFGDFDSPVTTDPLVSEGGSTRVSRGWLLERHRGELPVGVPRNAFSNVPLVLHRVPFGPESVWSHQPCGAG